MERTRDNSTLTRLTQDFEHLHGRIVDVEALAHAAIGSLQHIPYVPPGGAGGSRANGAAGAVEWPSNGELRLHYRRLHALVRATAEAAEAALGEAYTYANALYALRGQRNDGSSAAREPRASYSHRHPAPPSGRNRRDDAPASRASAEAPASATSA